METTFKSNKEKQIRGKKWKQINKKIKENKLGKKIETNHAKKIARHLINLAGEQTHVPDLAGRFCVASKESIQNKKNN